MLKVIEIYIHYESRSSILWFITTSDIYLVYQTLGVRDYRSLLQETLIFCSGFIFFRET